MVLGWGFEYEYGTDSSMKKHRKEKYIECTNNHNLICNMISVKEAILKALLVFKRRKYYQESFHGKDGPRSMARLWTGMLHPGGAHAI